MDLDLHNLGRFFFVPPLLAAVILSSGCTPETARWSPAEAPKVNKVEFVALDHEVRFEPGRAVAVPGQRKALARFFRDVALRWGDQVTVDAGPFSGDAPHDALTEERLRATLALLRHLNVTATRARRPTIAAALARDGVVVTLGRYLVVTPRCPDRSKPEADDFTNTSPSNFGCANVTDLGLMVANPADLLQGAPAGPADADFLARGVERYRSGQIDKSLPSESAHGSGGNSSSAGGNGE